MKIKPLEEIDVKRAIDIKGKNRFVIASSVGGTVKVFRWDGYDIIYPHTIKKKKVGKFKTKKKWRGGIPICFPFFGPPIKKYEGRIPQHGWLRTQNLKADQENDQRLRFSGINCRGSEYNYGFWLTQAVTVELSERKGLEVMLLVTKPHQEGEKPGKPWKAPANPAFHPYFSNLGNRSVKIGKEVITEFNKKAVILPVEKKNIFIDLGAKKVRMTVTCNLKLKPYYVALWSDSKDYFCVEPILDHPSKVGTKEERGFKKFFQMKIALKVIK